MAPPVSEVPSDIIVDLSAGWEVGHQPCKYNAVIQLPQNFQSSLSWDQNTFSSQDQYTHVLTDEEKEEINSALTFFKSLELDGDQVSQDAFPLPTLEKKLFALAKDIHKGKGFGVVRGLDPKDYSDEDNVLILLGISSYIAETRAKQDEDGSMLVHIRNAKESSIPESYRPIRYSTRASKYHTDGYIDVLALQTRSCAAKGGHHSIASAYTIFNKIAAANPRLIPVLFNKQWPFHSARPKLDGPPHKRALYFYDGEHLILDLNRDPIEGPKGPDRPAEHPPLKPEQQLALDEIERLSEENKIVLTHQPGDLTFINNHAIVHSREAFEDDEVNQRYFVRMWLKNKEMAWDLPKILRDGNYRIFEGNEDVEERWNIKVEPLLVMPFVPQWMMSTS
ncbi:hypothetical protein H072_9847 [Dactylellina haptotyla CBS 200.50]|uniref:TauD/TfdA-like domain-containing protein n=1 Tax=Dactylellina haptotyla (strain CBS 200.50) TaxID=1284197 RepID=S8A5Y9_DACHA|nr:hypothetical protein H072_9847 [Dactylellina haptotyla CBS 200.50]